MITILQEEVLSLRRMAGYERIPGQYLRLKSKKEQKRLRGRCKRCKRLVRIRLNGVTYQHGWAGVSCSGSASHPLTLLVLCTVCNRDNVTIKLPANTFRAHNTSLEHPGNLCEAGGKVACLEAGTRNAYLAVNT